MGTVAKTAILGGKKVFRDHAERQNGTHLPEDLLWLTLERAGVKNVAQHIVQGDVLTEAEIESLLRTATIPILIKLTELARFPEEITPENLNPHSSVLIPLLSISLSYQGVRVDEWIQDHVLPGTHLFFRDLDYQSFTSGKLEEVATAYSEIPGVKLLAPSFEVLLRDIQDHFHDLTATQRTDRLVDLIEGLKGIGFEDVYSVSSLAGFQLLSDLGVSSTYRFEFDPSAPIEEHIHHLYGLKEVVTSGVSCGWEISPRRSQRVDEAVSFEADALRLLAVGFLTLRNIPWHILSSHFFSQDTLEFATKIGANSLGYGALDENTARLLGIESYNTLEPLVKSERDKGVVVQ